MLILGDYESVTHASRNAGRSTAAALQSIQVPLALTPTFGRLEVSTFNAMRAADPVAATVKEESRSLTQEPQRVVTVDLPPYSIAAGSPARVLRTIDGAGSGEPPPGGALSSSTA